MSDATNNLLYREPDLHNDGGPAFPSHGSMGEVVQPGMSLRDYLAIHATDEDVRYQAEMLLEQMRASGGSCVLPDQWRVRARYMHADAMLKAREVRS